MMSAITEQTNTNNTVYSDNYDDDDDDEEREVDDENEDEEGNEDEIDNDDEEEEEEDSQIHSNNNNAFININHCTDANSTQSFQHSQFNEPIDDQRSLDKFEDSEDNDDSLYDDNMPVPIVCLSVNGKSVNNNKNSKKKTNTNNNKRFRTQMTATMINVMRSIFADCKTPTMAECQKLGKELGLAKRVVQVWFQNARAKEKKARSSFMKSFGQDLIKSNDSNGCTICNVKYNQKKFTITMQEHLFSKIHIDNVKQRLQAEMPETALSDDNAFDVSEMTNHNRNLQSNIDSTASLENAAAAVAAAAANNNTAQLLQQLQMIQSLTSIQQQQQQPNPPLTPAHFNLGELIQAAAFKNSS